MHVRRSLALAFAMIIGAAPAAAQDDEQGASKDGRYVMIGAGVELVPKYPGADSVKPGFLPLFDTWSEDEQQPAESPDESIGFALAGRRGTGLSAGPSFTFTSGRSTDDLPGLPGIGTTVELGGFVEAWPLSGLRLRGELRQGIGGHKALNGELAADAVWRGTREGTILTIGPRLRWGTGKYNQAFFGVPTANGAGYTPFEAEGGVYSWGAAAGLRLPLNERLGLYTYARYDRLADGVARSPIVVNGSADQFSAGVALTFRFGL